MISMKEVAARAGTSVTTVSHVVNRTRYVAPETVERVQKAIDELGFHPNRAARVLARGANDLLGLIISDITNPFFPELVKGFERAALRLGCEITLANTNYDPRRTNACVERLLAERVRGIAVLTSEMDPALIQNLRRHQVPVVYLDMGQADTYAANIVIDYDSGIDQAVQHLTSLGHNRIGLISGPAELRSAQQRLRAFERAAERYKLHAVVETADMRQEGGEQAAARLLQASEPPTGIIAANDLMAFGALRAIHGAGLRVPEDVSVVGFDNILFSAVTHPPLTTVEVSRTELGVIAAEALRRISSSSNHMGAEYRLKTTLVVRESTGPAIPATAKPNRKSVQAP